MKTESKKIQIEQNKFRKNCRLTGFGSRRCKAWRVPGTPEHGRDHMLSVCWQRAKDSENKKG